MFLILFACSSIESANLLTSGFVADYEVSSDGEAATLTASFRAGDGLGADWIELVGEDTVAASVEGEAVALDMQKSFHRFSYEAEIDTPAAGSEVAFSLSRSDGEDAPASAVTVPEPFGIDAPADGDSFTPADGDLTVRWSPSGEGDPIDVSVSGGCIEGGSDSLDDDPGSYTFDTRAFDPSTDPEEGEALPSCDISITVTRWRMGEADPALSEDSEIRAEQVRTVSLSFTPDPEAGARGCATGGADPSGLALALGVAGAILRRRGR